MAIFSLVTSAWKSTMRTFTVRVQIVQDLVGLAEGAIGRRHVHAALEIDHGAGDAVARREPR